MLSSGDQSCPLPLAGPTPNVRPPLSSPFASMTYRVLSTGVARWNRTYVWFRDHAGKAELPLVAVNRTTPDASEFMEKISWEV